MEDGQARLADAVAAFLDVTDRIAKDDLSRPTACEEWDVAGVLNAVIVKAGIFATAVGEPVPNKPSPWPELVTADFRSSVAAALAALVEAYEDGDLAAELVLPMGAAPLPMARGAATLDVTLHAWDLADTIGTELAAGPELVGHCLHVAAALVGDELRQRGEFAAPLAVAPEATDLDRLLAATGRRSIGQ